ncbi:MAG: 30S ribosomal protein S6 [Candidatus Binataceae bacterium]
MRRYETIFILRSDLGEAQINESIKRFEGIVAGSGGELIETDVWGSRELAYNIGRERRGHYIRFDYAAPGAAMNELERNLKLADDVLRYLSVLVAPEADAAKLRGEIESRKQKLAESRAAAAAAASSRETAEMGEAAEAEGGEDETSEPAESDGGTESN